MRKTPIFLFIFLFTISFVNAVSYEDSGTLYEIVSEIDDRDEFIVLLSLLNDDGLDLRNEVELSGLLIEKADEFDVDLNDYGDLNLYESIFSKASWHVSNYITGFASVYGKDEETVVVDTSKYVVVGDTTMQTDWSEYQQQAQTSDGSYVFNPSGTYVTQSEVYTALEDSGVEDPLSYTIDDVINNEILFEILIGFLGYSPLLVLPNQAIASYDGKITTYDGDKYSEETLLEILANEGMGVIEGKILEGLKYKEVMDVLKEKLKVNKIISPLEKGEIRLVCRKDTIWGAIVIGNEVIKFVSPIKECKFRCENGKCVDKEVVKPLEPEEIKPERESAEIKKEGIIKKEIQIIYRKPQPLSVTEISNRLKPLLAAVECKPRCEHSCGEPNGCGGKCPVSNLGVPGKCGVPTIIEEPKTAEEVFIKTTTNVASVAQVAIYWVLGIFN